MSTYVAEELCFRIEEADRGRCRYSLTSEANSGIPLTLDHLTPISKGGLTSFENVCLACRPCNELKSDGVTVIDPFTGETVPLFNPRTERWNDHFAWSSDATRVEGQPPLVEPRSSPSG